MKTRVITSAVLVLALLLMALIPYKWLAAAVFGILMAVGGIVLIILACAGGDCDCDADCCACDGCDCCDCCDRGGSSDTQAGHVARKQRKRMWERDGR